MEKSIKYDYVAEFFDIYLKKYLGLQQDIISVEEEDNIKFINYYSEYHNSSDKHPYEKNETEALADSYMFFISNHVIIVKNNRHYIDSEKLVKVNEYYMTNIHPKTKKLS